MTPNETIETIMALEPSVTRVRVTTPRSRLEGVFRARIAEADPARAFFAWRDGKAIWVTGMFDYFIAIDEITKLEVLADEEA